MKKNDISFNGKRATLNGQQVANIYPFFVPMEGALISGLENGQPKVPGK